MEKSGNSAGQSAVKGRNVVFVLVGVTVLLMKRNYAGFARDFVQSYAGNVSVSFAVYFILANLPFPARYSRALRALLGLLLVELFEATNGFAVMTNTYDPGDFLANGVGIALALAADLLTNRQKGAHDER
jgi:hypothetical protein